MFLIGWYKRVNKRVNGVLHVGHAYYFEGT